MVYDRRVAHWSYGFLTSGQPSLLNPKKEELQMKKSAFTKGLVAGALLVGLNAGVLTVAFADTTGISQTDTTTTSTSTTVSDTSTDTTTNSANTTASDTSTATTTTDTTSSTSSTSTTSGTSDTSTASSSTGTSPTGTGDSSSTDNTSTSDGSSSTNQSTTSASNSVSAELLTLIQVTVQQIQEALASNDVQKAVSLAKYLQQQITNANTLIRHGKLAQAANGLEQAITHVAKGKNVPLSQETLGDITNAEKVSTQFAKNLVSLTQALGHVKNAKAQAALVKNVAKSLDRLEQNLNALAQKQTAQQGKRTKDGSQTKATDQQQITVHTSGKGQAQKGQSDKGQTSVYSNASSNQSQSITGTHGRSQGSSHAAAGHGHH
jgi:hypothetical protein